MMRFEPQNTAKGAADNSGIFYHGIEKEGQPIYYSAPEYQLLDNA